MTSISEVTALLDANGGDDALIGIQFDNSIFGYFDTEDRKFDRSKNLVSIGGIDYVMIEDVMNSKPFGRLDLKIKSYHPIDMIQVLLFIEDVNKRPYMQVDRFLQERY